MASKVYSSLNESEIIVFALNLTTQMQSNSYNASDQIIRPQVVAKVPSGYLLGP